MRVKLLLALVFTAAVTAVPSGERQAAASRPWLAEAQGAATWLRGVATQTQNGLAWAGTPGPTAAIVTNLYSGSAGVVLFFLELHKATGNPADLETARSGALYLASVVDSERDAGLYTGAAGLGFTLTEAWKATKDVKLRDAANRVVDRLKATAKRVGDGVEWSGVSDIISGTSGIGLYLLSAARDLNRPDAKALATAAGRRLLAQEIQAEGGVKWAMQPAMPTRLYPNFSHGTAGVAYFLATLAQETGEASFREAALAGAKYLLKVAKTDGDVCLVFHHEPEAEGLDLFYLGWCHGPAGTARLFQRLAVVTGDRAWKDWVRKAANGIRQSGVPAQRTPGFWNNVGACCGSAGVADFFLSYYEETRDQAALAFAREMTAEITAKATRDESGTRWIHAENRVSPGQVAAQTGWMQGAAGIGAWYLRLDGVDQKRARLIRFPDSPF
jgi:lantibiotic modifying enzyme